MPSAGGIYCPERESGVDRTHARLWARPRSGETRVVVADGNGKGEARTDESARPLPAWKS